MLSAVVVEHPGDLCCHYLTDFWLTSTSLHPCSAQYATSTAALVCCKHSLHGYSVGEPNKNYITVIGSAGLQATAAISDVHTCWPMRFPAAGQAAHCRGCTHAIYCTCSKVQTTSTRTKLQKPKTLDSADTKASTQQGTPTSTYPAVCLVLAPYKGLHAVPTGGSTCTAHQVTEKHATSRRAKWRQVAAGTVSAQ